MRVTHLRPARLLLLPALLLSVVLAATGCGTTMRDVPIPGTGVSGDTIQVTANFTDALNLAQGALVKVNGVDSGKVTDITVDDFVATVKMTVRSDAKIRKGATARLRYTTPLGELFVDVTNPKSGKVLADKANLGLPETETAPTVEDALASASLLVNGGGLGQLQTVTTELNKILSGKEGQIKSLLRNATTFLTEANKTSGSIDRVLTSLNRVSGTLSAREKVINRVVKDIRPAVRVLREATPDFTRLLSEVRNFSTAANATVKATRSQLLTLLSEVQPVLAELASNRGRFNTMLRRIVSAAGAAKEAIPGDYITLDVTIDVRGQSLLETIAGLPGGLLDALGLDDLLDDLGLGDLLGLGRTATGTRSTTEDGDGPGGGGVPAGLDDLLKGLTGGEQR